MRLMLVALVVPMSRATADAVSRSGVRTLVLAWAVPEIRKLAVWSLLFWFCMKFVAVGASTAASQVETTPAFVHSSVVLVDD